MRVSTILFMTLHTNNIIKNIHFPSCKNCVYYKPRLTETDFTSPFNKCMKFGTKNIITDEISYDYADSCRIDEIKCGIAGKYFKKEDNIEFKIMKHSVISKLPVILFSIWISLCIFKAFI